MPKIKKTKKRPPVNPAAPKESAPRRPTIMVSVRVIRVWPTLPIIIGTASRIVLRLSEVNLDSDNFSDLWEGFFHTNFNAIFQRRRRAWASRTSSAHMDIENIVFVFIKNNVAAIQSHHRADFDI